LEVSAGLDHSLKKEVLIDLVSFFVSLLLVHFFAWQAADLVWALWLSSFTVGFAYILRSILSFIFLMRKSNFQTKYGVKELLKAQLIIAPIGIFMIAFFAVHFGGFHFIQGSFLDMLFPLSAFEVFKSWKLSNFHSHWWILMTLYWPFVLASCFSQRSLFVEKANPQLQPLKAYTNVIRMHLMIFVFIGCRGLEVDNFIVYVLVLFAYFSPWKSMREIWSGMKASPLKKE
jgi:hypothetical protein